MNKSSTEARRRTLAVTASAIAVCIGVSGCSSNESQVAESAQRSVRQAIPVIEPGQDTPMIANGVSIRPGAYIYKSSGLGPEALNTSAPTGTPEAYIDPSTFSGGVLTDGVSITEAQGLNALARIKANLESQGLTVADVTSMRVFLDNPPGTDRADFAGWNRAYRQYFANTNLATGDTELVPLGNGAPRAPLERNPARPSRYAIEVASLPSLGWLVEVEVDAVYPDGQTPPQ